MATIEVEIKVTQKEKEASIRALDRGGKIDPLELVEAARDPDHPCHGDFTWDVEEAAAKCWRYEARKLIRSLGFKVMVEDVGQRVVAYVASGDEDAVFVSVPKIRGKNQVREMLLAEAAMLVGNASRMYGLFVAKQNIIGAGMVSQVAAIRDQAAALKAELEE